MVNDSHGRAAALLDSAGPGTSGPAPSRARRSGHVRPAKTVRPTNQEPDGSELIRVPLCEGPIELRVRREAGRAKKRPPQQHIEGFNADATPC